MAMLAASFQTWKLKLSTARSVRILHVHHNVARCLKENMTSVCLIYGKIFLKIAMFMAILIFHYKMATFRQY